MALEVEYTMEYQHPGLPVTEDCWLQRKSADSPVMDRKKAVVSYKPTLLRCSLIRPVLPAPISFRRTVEPPGTSYRPLLHL